MQENRLSKILGFTKLTSFFTKKNTDELTISKQMNLTAQLNPRMKTKHLDSQGTSKKSHYTKVSPNNPSRIFPTPKQAISTQASPRSETPQK